MASETSMTRANPLLEAWTTPFEMPPFEAITHEHYAPAFEQALAEHKRDIDAIAADPAAPTFGNTLVAMEKSGETLSRVASVFFNLTSSDTSPELQAIERAMAPQLAAHSSEIMLNGRLFARVDDLWQRRASLGLDAESARLLERSHIGFVRSGARLDETGKARMKQIAERLAVLGTKFSQNVLADEQAFRLVLEGEADLAGLPEAQRAAALQAGKDLGLEGKHVITLARSSIEPFLVFSTRRDLREKAFEAWLKRGESGGETDNRKVAAEIIALRDERSKLLGYPSYAHFRTSDTMAGTPEAVRDLLGRVWPAALSRANRERDKLQAVMDRDGANAKLSAADWRHYAEKVRRAEHSLDESEIKPYFQLDRMIEASFYVASRLFGLTFTELHGLPRYRPEVRTWEVKDSSGRHMGLFLGDYFARPSKRSGAWMSAFRRQEKIDREVRPIIVNCLNFAKGADGEPTLLSLDDVRTLFHEFGHGLHGLLSDVTYESLACTSVDRDFVELPSQLYEHWVLTEEVLSRFARHYKTGEALPTALANRIRAAKTFNQGFQTVEYVACALLDLDLHLKGAKGDLDLSSFEREGLQRIGMPAEIAMRHRLPHFLHIFSGGGYASGYYSYMWSEVMDADAFAAFEEAGDVFEPATAKRLRDFVYAAGNRQDPRAAYTAFRGRMPEIGPLLEKRGLA